MLVESPGIEEVRSCQQGLHLSGKVLITVGRCKELTWSLGPRMPL